MVHIHFQYKTNLERYYKLQPLYFLAIFIGGLTCLLFSAGVLAADWIATKPIRLIIPYASGGTTDLIGRIISTPFAKALGQSVLVENKGGGGGVIGILAATNSQPDGYTIVLPALGAYAANETLLQPLPYNSTKDLQALTFIGESPLVLVISATNTFASLNQLLARSKETGQPITFASGGIGLSAHIAGELVKIQTKTDMTHIAYKGGGPAMVDVIGGQVDMLFAPLGSVLPLVQSGKLRAIAIASKERSSKLSTVPTMQELGFQNFIMAESWGLLAPAGLPNDVSRKLRDSMISVIQQPDVIKRCDEQGVTLKSSTPQQLQDYIQSEIKKYREVIINAKIKVE